MKNKNKKIADTVAGPAAPGDDENSGREKKKKLSKIKKEAKKEAKRQKRRLKRNEDAVVCKPERMNGFPLSIPIGYLLRFFSIGLSVFGVCALFVDSFEIAGINLPLLLLFCIGAVAAFSMIFIGKKPVIAGIGMIALYIGAVWIFVGSPLTFTVSGIEAVYNKAMSTLSEYGYAAGGSISLPTLGALHAADVQTALTYGGMFTFAGVLSQIFSAFSAKRTRILPMLLVGGSVCAVCFTYNLSGTNTGIICILAGLTSTLVLAAYDRTYAANKKSRKSVSYSGFSSALAGLLVLAVLFPFSSIKAPWREIKSVSSPISSARTLVMTILTGGDPRLNLMNSPIEKRSAKLEKLEFQNVPLFEVTSYLRGSNIYLRSWIASDFDKSDDTWSMLSEEDYNNMLAEMRSDYSGITGDAITYAYYRMLDKWLAADAIPKDSSYTNLTGGYNASYVDIGSIKSTGLLYTLPSSFVQSAGLFENKSRTDRYGESAELMSDGMYKSGWLNLRKKFTALAITPTYMGRNYAERADLQAQYTALLADFLLNTTGVASMDAEEVREKFAARLESAGLSSFGTDGLDSFLAASNRRMWITENVRAAEEYSDYVHRFYTAGADIEGVKTVADLIRPDFDGAATTYEKIMTVVDYMIKNYSYTLSPDKPSSEYSSDVDAFLLETKNGYCVHFATAAALILRELGIPARYVQGYIASGAYKSTGESGETVYKTTVMDKNAHAWVEVWIDGLGWRTVEVTPQYYSDIYYINRGNTEISDIVKPTTTKPSVTEPPEPDVTEKPPVTTSGEDDTADDKPFLSKEQITAIGVVFSAALLLAAIILIIIKREKHIANGRNYYVDKAVSGIFDSDDDMSETSRVLADHIYRMMYVTVGKPGKGESPAEYAYRIDHPPVPTDKKGEAAIKRRLAWSHSFTGITAIIEQAEFSGKIESEKLTMLGQFIKSFEKAEYGGLSFAKKLWYRYIRAII